MKRKIILALICITASLGFTGCNNSKYSESEATVLSTKVEATTSVLPTIAVITDSTEDATVKGYTTGNNGLSEIYEIKDFTVSQN